MNLKKKYFYSCLIILFLFFGSSHLAFAVPNSNNTDVINEDMEKYNTLDNETLESYRKRFKLHKGADHEWNNLTDKEFLHMIRALDRKTDRLTLAGLLMFGKVQDIVQVKPNYFLDYREINDITTERWSNRITSSEDECWSGNLWTFFTKIVNRLTADIEVPFALDKDMMRIDDTDVHKSVRERTCKYSYTYRLF